MCYLVREQQAGAGASAPTPGSQGLRPRWIGAAGLALVGAVALAAALVVPPAGAPEIDAQRLGAGAPEIDARQLGAAPVAAQSSIPPGTVVEQRQGLDDDVPGAAGFTKAGAGGCAHSL